MDVYVAIAPCFGVGFRQIFFVGLVDIDEAVFVVIIGRIAVSSGDLAENDAGVAHRLSRLAAERGGGFQYISAGCGDPPGEVPGLGVAIGGNFDAVPRIVVVGVGELLGRIAHTVTVGVGEKFIGGVAGAAVIHIGISLGTVPKTVAIAIDERFGRVPLPAAVRVGVGFADIPDAILVGVDERFGGIPIPIGVAIGEGLGRIK